MSSIETSMITIRGYKREDAKALASIYYHTIHTINIRDYTETQVNVWAPEASKETAGWMKKWDKLVPFVALIDEKPVGFVELEPTGHIDCFYVHHEHQGQGVGSALMKFIFNEAKKRKMKELFAEVSITAKPFFESHGFMVVKPQTIVRQGVELCNFVMRKSMIEHQLHSNI